MVEQECEFDGCEFPAQFRAQMVTNGPITGEEREHEGGYLCQMHTDRALEIHKGNRLTTVNVESNPLK